MRNRVHVYGGRDHWQINGNFYNHVRYLDRIQVPVHFSWILLSNPDHILSATFHPQETLQRAVTPVAGGIVETYGKAEGGRSFPSFRSGPQSCPRTLSLLPTLVSSPRVIAAHTHLLFHHNIPRTFILSHLRTVTVRGLCRAMHPSSEERREVREAARLLILTSSSSSPRETP